MTTMSLLTAYETKQLKDAYDRGEVSNQELAEMAAMNAATSAAGLIPLQQQNRRLQRQR